MKKELIIVIAVLMVGALAVYRGFNGSTLLLSNTRGTAKIDGESVNRPDAVKQKKDRPGKTPWAGLRIASGPSRTADPETPLPLAPPRRLECCQQKNAPFPTPDLVRKGSTAAEIRSTFGSPALHVAGTRQGLVEEKYFYLSPDQQRLTFISIENGHVISVEQINGLFIQPPIEDRSVP